LGVNAHGNPDDDAATELPRRLGGNRRDEPAVGEAAGADLDWFEQSGESATGPNGFDQRALTEYHRIASGEVSGNDRQGNFHIFKFSRFEYAFNQVGEAMIAGEAEPRNAPARDIAKTDGAADGDNSCQGSATGVGGSEDAADAGAGNMRYGDVILFQHLQHSEMREATREPAAERESNAWARGHLNFGEFEGAFH
jgi:hypothetical protein